MCEQRIYTCTRLIRTKYVHCSNQAKMSLLEPISITQLLFIVIYCFPMIQIPMIQINFIVEASLSPNYHYQLLFCQPITMEYFAYICGLVPRWARAVKQKWAFHLLWEKLNGTWKDYFIYISWWPEGSRFYSNTAGQFWSNLICVIDWPMNLTLP